MAIPFQVFEFDYSNYFPKHVWCVRCENWVPVEEASGAASDPHVADHIHAWMAMRAIEEGWKFLGRERSA